MYLRNASDIPEGDFNAAKREVERLRFLIAKVDHNMLEEISKFEGIDITFYCYSNLILI